MDVHGGHGARLRFLERDAESHIRTGGSESGGVGRKEIERGVVRQPDRETLVPDEERGVAYAAGEAHDKAADETTLQWLRQQARDRRKPT
jgi:hypothetical protein